MDLGLHSSVPSSARASSSREVPPARRPRWVQKWAKQANDDELMKMASRIRDRAIRRAGELLKQIDGQGNNQHSVATHTKLSQREAAEQAGMSKHQQVQAVRVANVPEPEFERQVE